VSIVKLAPSILSADFARLGQQVAEAADAGADRIHVDVMDGHFVPNLSMGPAVVRSLRRVTHLPLEIHLMIADPDFFLDEFAEAGSDSLLVHWEGNSNSRTSSPRSSPMTSSSTAAIPTTSTTFGAPRSFPRRAFIIVTWVQAAASGASSAAIAR